MNYYINLTNEPFRKRFPKTKLNLLERFPNKDFPMMNLLERFPNQKYTINEPFRK